MGSNIFEVIFSKNKNKQMYEDRKELIEVANCWKKFSNQLPRKAFEMYKKNFLENKTVQKFIKKLSDGQKTSTGSFLKKISESLDVNQVKDFKNYLWPNYLCHSSSHSSSFSVPTANQAVCNAFLKARNYLMILVETQKKIDETDYKEWMRRRAKEKEAYEKYKQEKKEAGERYRKYRLMCDELTKKITDIIKCKDKNRRKKIADEVLNKIFDVEDSNRRQNLIDDLIKTFKSESYKFSVNVRHPENFKEYIFITLKSFWIKTRFYEESLFRKNFLRLVLNMFDESYTHSEVMKDRSISNKLDNINNASKTVD